MRNIRNKKRLTALVIAFMMVFLSSAAFALQSGTLDIVGTVNIIAPEELYVVWYSVDPDGPVPVFVPAIFANNARHGAEIIDSRGRTDQTIAWDIYFDNEALGGQVALSATAFNNGLVPATITRVDYEWTDAGGNVINAATLFGLDVTITDAGFVGTLASLTESSPVIVGVEWDGTTPNNFTVPSGDTHAFAATLTITFSYAP